MKNILTIVLVLMARLSLGQWTVQNSNTTRQLEDIHFANDSVGFACGFLSTVIKTTDGGENWTDLYSGISASLFTIFTTNSDTVFTARTSYYRSLDGGGTWTDIYTSGSAIKDIYFHNSQVGIIATAGNVMRTVDGGSTWTEVYSDGGGYIQFVNSNIGYIKANYSAPPFKNQGIYKTTDGGMTWQSLGLDGLYNIIGLSFVNESIGYFVNDDTKMYKTTDGGNSWTLVNDSTPATVLPGTNCTFIDENEGYIYGNNIYRTIDGGLNWSIEYATDTLLLAFTRKPNGTAFITGRDGIILKKEITTGIRESQPRLSWGIYPNPASRHICLWIDNSSGKNYTLKIYEPQGHLVRTELNITTDRVEIETTNLSKGLYFVTLNDGGQVRATRKLIVQ